MRTTRHGLVRLGLAAALLLLPAAVGGEINRNPVFIRQELEQSVKFQKMALERLSNHAEALRLTWEAYVQLRSAHTNVQADLQLAKFPNPLYQLASTKLQKARDNLLLGRDALRTPDRYRGGPSEMEAAATARFQESVHLIEFVLMTTF